MCGCTVWLPTERGPATAACRTIKAFAGPARETSPHGPRATFHRSRHRATFRPWYSGCRRSLQPAFSRERGRLTAGRGRLDPMVIAPQLRVTVIQRQPCKPLTHTHRDARSAARTLRAIPDGYQRRNNPWDTRSNPVTRHPCLVILDPSFRSRQNAVKDLFARRFFTFAMTVEEPPP